MDKTVRDFDEAVIKDYKEDLDTLLVFVSRIQPVRITCIDLDDFYRPVYSPRS